MKNIYNMQRLNTSNDPAHNKTNKMKYAPSKDSDQPVHPPSLIVFAVHMKKPWVLGYPLDAQADLSLCWAHRSFCFFFHTATEFCFPDGEWKTRYETVKGRLDDVAQTQAKYLALQSQHKALAALVKDSDTS